VAAVFCILTVTSGIGFYNASVILAAAKNELGASVGSVSGATGMFFAISGLSGFVFAKRLDAVDIRWFFLAGGLIGAGALFSLRWVTSVAALYVFFAVFGIGFGTAGLVPATTLITRWFDRRRSVALSIASTGLSFGGIALIPVSAWLIDTRSLAGASPWLSLIWACGIIPIALLVLRSKPSDLGLRPDGERHDATSSDEPEAAGLGFSAARSTRFFVALCVAYALIYVGQVGAIAQLFNLVLERTDNATAATCLSALALTSVIARLIGGALVLRLPTRGFTAILAVLQAAALASLAVADSPAGLILSSVFFGASVGNLLMLQPLILAEAFGVAGYAQIYSFNQLFGTIGVAGGPPLLGLIRDAVDYEVAMLVAGGASFVGFVFIALAGSIGAVQARWRPAQ
jgi:MFS family permease